MTFPRLDYEKVEILSWVSTLALSWTLALREGNCHVVKQPCEEAGVRKEEDLPTNTCASLEEETPTPS